MSQFIRIEQTGGVFRIEMARPEKKNALTAEMYQALANALADAEADPAVRVILISGAGGNFTAGNDLADFLDQPPMSRTRATCVHLPPCCRALAIGISMSTLPIAAASLVVAATS